MEDTESMMNFIAPKEQSSYIKVIGVGGGGTNAVNHMYREGITGVDFIVCNTDAKSLASSPVTNKIQLGDGLGAGNKPEVAKRYATENMDSIREALSQNTKMLFITAGMGGGTGTGASPIIAQVAKEIDLDDKDVPKILVVAIVTMPFNFEGSARKQQAEEGVKELRKYVDSILIIDNNKVLGGEKMPFRKAFAKADDVLLTAAKSVAEMITVKAYVDTDFRDVNTVMKDSGTALMGAGIASGENRAIEAIQQAVNSPLLNDSDISDARNILMHITCSEEHEFDTDEMEEVTSYITSICKQEPTIIWGIGYDDALEENLRIIVVATGFKMSNKQQPTATQKPTAQEITQKAPKVHVLDEPVVTQKEDPKPMADTEFVVTPAAETSTPTTDVPVEPVATVAPEPMAEEKPQVFDLDDAPAPVKEEKVTPQQWDENTPTSNDDFELISKTETAPQMVTDTPVATVTRLAEPTAPEPAPAAPVHIITDHEEVKRNQLESEVLSRRDAILKIKNQISTAEGLSDFESIPAYIRNGQVLESAPKANELENKTYIGKDGQMHDNDFLYRSVD